MREVGERVAEEMKETVHQGVYAMVGGPQLETRAEINMLRVLGADLVGQTLSVSLSNRAMLSLRIFTETPSYYL